VLRALALVTEKKRASARTVSRIALRQDWHLRLCVSA
jgi:hypothetical protein